ncbi:unnamed protein product [Prorocentrum cordatum]|uniref:Uncharacterized protein n=1 Tax=Prorocentrum cordatum TaxID=2364126 RepID=A0ABN9XLQ4_9DINO|nr:unnamed protein product [Polarella glacialis]
MQEVEMHFALYETTRLYAFAGGVLPGGKTVLGCKVLVLPHRDDIVAYADIMDEEKATCGDRAAVYLTKRGDREAVRFNFFKYSYSFGQAV